MGDTLMPSLFSGPPRLPPAPKLAPPQNSLLTQQLRAISRRTGDNAAVLTPTQRTGGGTSLTRGLTGS